MYIELTCRSCGNAFRLDFTKSEITTSRCPICHKVINQNDIGRLSSLTEAYYASEKWCSDVSVNSLHSNSSIEVETLNRAATVFHEDIAELNNLYRAATPEVQKLLAAMIDKFFLLVHTDAQKGDSQKLESTKEQLGAMVNEKIHSIQSEMAKTLGVEVSF